MADEFEAFIDAASASLTEAATLPGGTLTAPLAVHLALLRRATYGAARLVHAEQTALDATNERLARLRLETRRLARQKARQDAALAEVRAELARSDLPALRQKYALTGDDVAAAVEQRRVAVRAKALEKARLVAAQRAARGGTISEFVESPPRKLATWLHELVSMSRRIHDLLQAQASGDASTREPSREPSREPREPREPRDERRGEKRDARGARKGDTRDVGEPKGAGSRSREPRYRDVRDSRDARDRDSRTSRDSRDSRDPRDSRDSREARDSRDRGARSARDARDGSTRDDTRGDGRRDVRAKKRRVQ